MRVEIRHAMQDIGCGKLSAAKVCRRCCSDLETARVEDGGWRMEVVVDGEDGRADVHAARKSSKRGAR